MKKVNVVFNRKLHKKVRWQTFCLSILLCLFIFLTGCSNNFAKNGSAQASEITASQGTKHSSGGGAGIDGDVVQSKPLARPFANVYGKEILAPVSFLILDINDMPLVNARVQVEDFPYAGVTTYEGKVVFTFSPDSDATPLYEGDYTMRIEQDTLSDEPDIEYVSFSLSAKSPDTDTILRISGERTHDLLLTSTIRIEFLAAYTAGPPAKNLQVILQCEGNCADEGESVKYYHGFTDEIGRVAFVGVDPYHKYTLSFLWYGGNPIALSYAAPDNVTGNVDMTLAEDGWYVGEVPMASLDISSEDLSDVIKVRLSIRRAEK